MTSGISLTPTSHVAILGFASRTATFATLLVPRGCALRVWDPRLATRGAEFSTRIEAMGVDVMTDLASALRGARLVVVDTGSEVPEVHVPPLAGQQRLDLATAPAAEIEAALVALGLPPAAADWEAACAARSGTATAEPACVRRGELP